MPKRIDETELAQARRLRRTMTSAETMLWRALRDRRLSKYKFRRQFPVGPYVADFACIPARVIVELDGASHATPEAQDHDEIRDIWLHEHGWRILRLSNDLILGGGDIALEIIAKELRAAPAPSSDLR